MIATLPMYDWPEVRAATDAWWHGLSKHLGVTLQLERNADYASAWRHPGLFFSQTCGYPFTHEFKGLLNYVSTPHYAAPGCDGATYCSLIFTRRALPPEAFRNRIAAVNSRDSMSGMLALKLVFAPLAAGGKFFAGAIETGGHINSLLAVRDGKADVCAIDSVCVAMARRYRPDYLEGLIEIARSPAVPGLPYVIRSGDVGAIRAGLRAAFSDPQLQEARDHLFLSGNSVLQPQAYDCIAYLEAAMQRAGGLDLL